MNISKIIRYNNTNQYLVDVLQAKGLMHRYDTIWFRISRGWSGQRAIDKPFGKYTKL